MALHKGGSSHQSRTDTSIPGGQTGPTNKMPKQESTGGNILESRVIQYIKDVRPKV
ncbi:MAG: hypothetical protein V3T23_08520 [Nitrososphaerales archaeon]